MTERGLPAPHNNDPAVLCTLLSLHPVWGSAIQTKGHVQLECLADTEKNDETLKVEPKRKTNLEFFPITGNKIVPYKISRNLCIKWKTVVLYLN